MRRLGLLVAVAILATPPTVAARELRVGMHGTDVKHVEQRLAKLRYLPAKAADGNFDWRTWHAVVAFQGWSHVPRDGVVTKRLRKRLDRAGRPVPWSRATGIEVHLTEQVMLLVRDRRVWRVVHVSTGAAGATPTGRYVVNRREAMSWSHKFRVWMPYAQYFVGGYAMHAYPSVPTYPASHGCVRLPSDEAPTVWGFGRFGMRVWVDYAGRGRMRR